MEDKIKEILKTIKFPGYTRDIVSFGMVKSIKVSGDSAEIELYINTRNQEAAEKVKREVEEKVSSIEGITKVTVKLTTLAQKEPPKPKAQVSTKSSPFADQRKIEGVKCVIAVASGKGGVGKTTVAVNLALALAKKGYSVGIMDADVYGPNVPTMMGIEGAVPRVTQNNKIIPVEVGGIKVISVGFFVEKDQPVIWRGPLVSKLIEQFLRDVIWAPLDILIVDLPPGTGDVQLSLVQKVPVDGGVVVTTPQELALQDARKATKMFEEVGVPVIGIIENMSYLICPHCGKRIDLFPHAGAKKAAQDMGTKYLGEIPFEPRAAEGSDAGKPVVLYFPDSPQTEAFLNLADVVVRETDCIEPIQ